MPRILLSPTMKNPDFASAHRMAVIDRLSKHGAVGFYPGALTENEADGVIGVIANSQPIHTEFYRRAKDLRIIARWGVGFENVNLQAANEAGVFVTVSPVHMTTVAEYTIAQWMATLKRTYTLNHLSHHGDFSIIRTYEAEGSTLGLFGCGRIGQAVAERAKPLLGATGRLLLYDIRPDTGAIAARLGADVVASPRDLFARSDTVSLHVAGDATVVTYDLLCAMPPHASLINPSRGNLVDDEAVHRAIEEERLWYYVVDDPVNGPRARHKGHPRIICTNHNGGITTASVNRLDDCTATQVIDALEGRRPQHILNPEVLSHPRIRSFLIS